MTCICTDGKTMAADGQSSRMDMIVGLRRTKLHRLPDGSVVGMAGDGGLIELALEWFRNGEDTSEIPATRGQDFCALILRPSGRVDLLDGLFVRYRAEAPAAIGTGDQMALGALLAGATPREAVKLVASRCTTVGGRITEMAPTRRKD